MVGFPRGRRPARITEALERSEKIRSLLESGWGYADIAKAYDLAYQEIYEIAFPQRARAWREFLYAEAVGEIDRPNHCEGCGKRTDDIQGHHDDYSKPLVVRWLCVRCHADQHIGNHDRRVPGLDASTQLAVWTVAKARQVRWSALLDMMTVPEIVATYRGYLGIYARPQDHTIAAVDARNAASRGEAA